MIVEWGGGEFMMFVVFAFFSSMVVEFLVLPGDRGVLWITHDYNIDYILLSEYALISFLTNLFLSCTLKTSLSKDKKIVNLVLGFLCPIFTHLSFNIHLKRKSCAAARCSSISCLESNHGSTAWSSESRTHSDMKSAYCLATLKRKGNCLSPPYD
jgi:hypothetical protein